MHNIWGTVKLLYGKTGLNMAMTKNQLKFIFHAAGTTYN